MSAPALFLDRDGTIIVDTDFVRSPEEVTLLPGAASAIRRANDAGWRVVIITNQSGIARGLMSEADYLDVASELERQLAQEGARVDLQLYCPHFPPITGPCECRKPGLRLYREAIQRLDIATAWSWFVGDRLRDLEPALLLGGQALHVLTGMRSEDAVISGRGFRSVDDLSSAVDLALAD